MSFRRSSHSVASWTWSTDGGACITEDSKVIWDAYVKKNPGAAPFKNKGWVHLDAESSTTEFPSQSQALFGDDNELYQDDTNNLRRSLSPPPVYPAASNSQSTVKRPRPSGASALESLSNSVNDFSSTIKDALFPSKDGLPATPRCETDAVVCVQALEKSWLTGFQLILFIDLLRRDVSAVDVYSVLEDESLRKEWVAAQLDM
ncbi:hypothetical protein FPV67DRAFT_1451983 [Lyophyllum atratum]|nr:hypothetical protein FPV67DRAFT_1451983 [Lyophyllum atratum]